jgi:hypothetical protein
MTPADSKAVNVPSRDRGQSAAEDGGTRVRPETRHDFQARGSAKHLERLASAKEQGVYGVVLNVCYSDRIARGPLSVGC